MATARVGWCATAFLVFGLLAAASAGPAKSTVSPYGDAVLADQPMAFWRLNDAAGSTSFVDSSGHGYVLTPDNQDTLGVGGALDGDSNAGMHTPTSSATSDWGNGVGTVYAAEFWYASDAPAGSNGIGLVSYNSGSSRGRTWAIRITSSGVVQTTINENLAGNVRTIDGPSDIPADDGAWHYIVVLLNSDLSQVFVDGQAGAAGGSVGPGPCAPGVFCPPGTTASLFSIAGPGTFDEVALYGSVLPTARMDVHFAAARPWGDGADPSSDPTDPTPGAGPIDEADADDPPPGAPAAPAAPDDTDPGTTVDVSRNAIVNYAFAYVGTKRGSFDTTGYNTLYAPAAGTDCQNFVSQALRAGGWPDDVPAGSDPLSPTVWWEQPPNQNSFTWTVVTYFWRYAQQSGRGAYVKYWSSAQPGDVVLVDWDGAHGHPTHSMLVTATARTSSGAVQVYFTYHSRNRKNYPLTTLRHDFPHAHWWLFHLRDQF